MYLAVVLDLFSRKVVGWAMSAQMNTALVETASRMALQTRQPDAPLLHHSDQGSQYTSAAYRSRLAGTNIQLSMSRVGNCYDNAVAESFFGTLKAECVTSQFATHALARTTIFEYIEVWYNSPALTFHAWLSQPCRIRTATRTLIVSTKTGQAHITSFLIGNIRIHLPSEEPVVLHLFLRYVVNSIRCEGAIHW
jgi:hypothetical protein